MPGVLTFINDILLDWATAANIPTVFEVTNEPIQSTDISAISTHIRKVPREIVFEGAFEGSDRESRFRQLQDLGNKKSVVTFVQTDIMENMVITSLQPLDTYENIIRFSITLSQLNLAYVQRIARKASKIQRSTGKVKRKGKSGIKALSGPEAYPSVLWLKQ